MFSKLVASFVNSVKFMMNAGIQNDQYSADKKGAAECFVELDLDLDRL